ncbi:MAG: chromosomal replication initiator protein DnaA [Bdellovibrionota bacterium]
MKTIFPMDSSNNTLKISSTNFSEESNTSIPSLSSLSSLWGAIKNNLNYKLPKADYDTWIDPVQISSIKEGSYVNLLVPNMLFYQEFSDIYLDLINKEKVSLGYENITFRIEVPHNDLSSLHSHYDLELNNQIFQQTGSSIEREFSSKAETESHQRFNETFHTPTIENSPSKKISTASFGKSTASGSFSRALDKTPSYIDPAYTFDSFVRGPSNQFAVASCQNVAENPGVNYNPLFIYGHTGLGKTHLMHAVGNTVLEYRSDTVVTYVRSENFMNEMIYCIRHNKTWEFRQKYRNCDVLLVDDIQFISGKKATQEEFFHTFNSLYEAKKQIVITSDMFPQDIPDIEERLRNRFQWGLIADIQAPDIEHRMAILFNKAEKLGLQLQEDVAEYISTHAKRNVRELEGALHRIHAFATLHGRTIDLQLATETFQNVLGEPPKRLTIESIQKTVAEHFKIRISDLKSKKRQRALTLPRQIAMYLARTLTKSSFPEIGTNFGGKDHTTVMHAVKKITNDRNKDLDLKAHLESLERQLEQMY